MRKHSLPTIALFFLLLPAVGLDAETWAETPNIIVGTKQAPPFAMKSPGKDWEGLSIELWRIIAGELNVACEFREYDLKQLQDALTDGTIDVAVAALTITAEREKKYDFTHPFHIAGLGIAVNSGQRSGWVAVMEGFFSADFIRTVGLLALILAAVGVLVWFFERKGNEEQFGGRPYEGIGAAFWWSAVTMTTVGYGDKAPRTLGGRIVALVWMFFGIILISSFTAAITSALTVNQLSQLVRGPDDLPRVRVGSIENTTSEAYLTRKRIGFRSFATPLEGLDALADDRIDAMVYDAPILQHLVKTGRFDRVIVLQAPLEKQQYGFGLPEGSPLRESINRILIDKLNSPDWREILHTYLGETAN